MSTSFAFETEYRLTRIDQSFGRLSLRCALCNSGMHGFNWISNHETAFYFGVSKNETHSGRSCLNEHRDNIVKIAGAFLYTYTSKLLAVTSEIHLKSISTPSRSIDGVARIYFHSSSW